MYLSKERRSQLVGIFIEILNEVPEKDRANTKHELGEFLAAYVDRFLEFKVENDLLKAIIDGMKNS